METMIVDIKNKKEKEILIAFLSSLRISFHTESEEDESLPVTLAKEPDANALSGIWADNPRTVDELRKQAWGDRL